MNFFNILAKRRWYVVAFLAALLWFQVFVMFSSREALRVGVLQTGGVSVIKTLERTGSEFMLPVRGGRTRILLLVLLLLFKTVLSTYEKMSAEPFSAKSNLFYNIWEILIGKELASLPHSDMVLRN